jgi:hypothetical protein
MDLYTLTANQEHATKATKAAGVNKIYVQHPNHGGIVMSMAQMKEAVRLGALIEIVLSGEGLKGGGPQVVNAENPVMDYGPQKIADIRALGPANVVISTDLGQPGRVNYAQARELKTQKRGETAQVFRTLHSVNVEAIRKNDIVRSTEIVSQIHQLLASVWGFPLDEPPPYFPRQVIDLGGCSGERFVLAHPVRSGPQRPVRATCRIRGQFQRSLAPIPHGGCLVRRRGLDSALRWSAPAFRTTTSSERSAQVEWASCIWRSTSA